MVIVVVVMVVVTVMVVVVVVMAIVMVTPCHACLYPSLLLQQCKVLIIEIMRCCRILF
jgi:hypothetical protein